MTRRRLRRAAVTAAVVGGLLLLAGCGGGADGSSSPSEAVVPAVRDPLLWPFASTSIWNTPRGAAATLRAVAVTPPHVDLDLDHLVVTTAADPLTPTYDVASFGPGRCQGTRTQPQAAYHPALGQPIAVPAAFVLPDATAQPYSTPNAVSAFVDPDGHTLHQFDVTARCTAGGPLYGYRVADGDLRGDGRLGGHLGSGLSSTGGDVRPGELFGASPLDHALKVDLDGALLARDAASTTPGYRWPAVLADSDAPADYRGHDPDLVMGSLLTIPVSQTARSLHLRTAAGERLLVAFQRYGAYVADTTGSADASLCVDAGVPADYATRAGIALADDAALQADLRALFGSLEVVTDDGPTAVGGPGPRLAPPAPPLAAAP